MVLFSKHAMVFCSLVCTAYYIVCKKHYQKIFQDWFTNFFSGYYCFQLDTTFANQFQIGYISFAHIPVCHLSGLYYIGIKIQGFYNYPHLYICAGHTFCNTLYDGIIIRGKTRFSFYKYFSPDWMVAISNGTNFIFGKHNKYSLFSKKECG